MVYLRSNNAVVPQDLNDTSGSDLDNVRRKRQREKQSKRRGA